MGEDSRIKRERRERRARGEAEPETIGPRPQRSLTQDEVRAAIFRQEYATTTYRKANGSQAQISKRRVRS